MSDKPPIDPRYLQTHEPVGEPVDAYGNIIVTEYRKENRHKNRRPVATGIDFDPFTGE